MTGQISMFVAFLALIGSNIVLAPRPIKQDRCCLVGDF